MKHRLLLLSICVAIFSRSFAQPTLTSANSAPKIGDSYTSQQTKTTGVTTGSGGANQTWDYSALVDSGTAASYQGVSPSSTPYTSLFPTSNIALVVSGNSVFQYGLSNTNELRVLGVVIPGGDTLTYIKPRIYASFPFSYESFFTDTVIMHEAGFDVTYHGRDSLWGEGYGTLKLPGGQTFTNVLRVKSIENIVASKDTSLGPIPLTLILYTRTINYSYFTPGFDAPLLTINSAQTSNNLGLPINVPSAFQGLTISYAKDVLLPLQITSFTSVLQNNQVALKWQTAQEVNTNHFNIQRSFNGNDFTDIGKISATGNSLGSSYSYTDYNVEKLGVSKLYYRLQEIDKDGKAFYSGTNVIELRTINTTKAYPNPANGYINLNIKGATIADAVRIYDMKGRLMQQWQNYPVNRLINVKSFAAGSYILQVQVKGKTTSSTIVKE